MRAILGVILVAAIGVAIWYYVDRTGVLEPSAPAPAAEQPAPAETVAELRRDPGEGEEAAPNPSFDIVRIDSNGVTVAAGRADPGTRVILKLNGAEIAEADADAAGEWSIVLTDPLPPGAGELTLDMVLADGSVVESTQTVVVSIPESGAPLIVLGQPGQASRVLQGPQGSVGAGPLVLESVDYGETGAVLLAGRATPGAEVRVLADGREAGRAVAGPDGRWTMTVDEALPPGVYDLQIDQVEDGRVTAVVTLPFERVEPGALAGGRVVIQPGNNLWQIARRAYGEGLRYTVIYEANAAQIRDPDLIYPGQVFDIPPQ